MKADQQWNQINPGLPNMSDKSNLTEIPEISSMFLNNESWTRCRKRCFTGWKSNLLEKYTNIFNTGITHREIVPDNLDEEGDMICSSMKRVKSNFPASSPRDLLDNPSVSNESNADTAHDTISSEKLKRSRNGQHRISNFSIDHISEIEINTPKYSPNSPCYEKLKLSKNMGIPDQELKHDSTNSKSISVSIVKANVEISNNFNENNKPSCSINYQPFRMHHDPNHSDNGPSDSKNYTKEFPIINVPISRDFVGESPKFFAIKPIVDVAFFINNFAHIAESSLLNVTNCNVSTRRIKINSNQSNTEMDDEPMDLSCKSK